ncbi:hypothetical protein UPYG_G00219410 [Umbra pygmaea]|uniref:Uncharacterized protein n=1 Tax=Umbra pygmaea TaxID=75934 RepID=A0ABD0WMB3_UMBPY
MRKKQTSPAPKPYSHLASLQRGLPPLRVPQTPTPCYLTPPTVGFRLSLSAGVKTVMSWVSLCAVLYSNCECCCSVRLTWSELEGAQLKIIVSSQMKPYSLVSVLHLIGPKVVVKSNALFRVHAAVCGTAMLYSVSTISCLHPNSTAGVLLFCMLVCRKFLHSNWHPIP